MLGWLKKQLVGLVVTLVLGQIPIFKDDFEWEKFKETIKRKVPEWIPGTWFDGTAVSLALGIVSVFQEAVTQESLKELITLVVDGKMKEAWEYIQEKVIKLVDPSVSLAELGEKEKEEMFDKALASKLPEHVDTAQA